MMTFKRIVIYGGLLLLLGGGGYMGYSKIRGIRNNNPCNIRENDRVDYDWNGEAVIDNDDEFEVFISPKWGIRAAYRILMTYRNRGLDTIAEIIETWAPRFENDTDSYIDSVSKALGIDKNQQLSLVSYPALIKAIIKHENGIQPYSDETIAQGIALA